MNKIFLLIMIVFCNWNICLSQLDLKSDNTILLVGTIKSVNKADIIVEDLNVLTSNYSGSEIVLNVENKYQVGWIIPDTNWVGEKIIAQTKKYENNIYKINIRNQKITGAWLWLTPS